MALAVETYQEWVNELNIRITALENELSLKDEIIAKQEKKLTEARKIVEQYLETINVIKEEIL